MAMKSFRWYFVIILIVLFFLPARQILAASESKDTTDGKTPAGIHLPENMSNEMKREASQVGKQFQTHARSLFDRHPMGWDMDTLRDLYKWGLNLPMKIPDLLRYIIKQSRMLGAVGSILVLIFIIVVFYSLIGRKKVLHWIEAKAQPLQSKIPAAVFPYFFSLIKVLVASLIPLLLLGAFTFINALIKYQEPWFLLSGKLLGLWAIVVFLIKGLNVVLVEDLFEIASAHSTMVCRFLRLVLLYIASMLVIFWSSEAFSVPEETLAFIKFAISSSIVCLLLLLLRRKKEMLSLFPDLPYRSYQVFLKGLERYYAVIIGLTFISGLFWCFGYQTFAKDVWIRTWAVAFFFVLIIILYHILRGGLERWAESVGTMSEEADFLFQSARMMMVYVTVLAIAITTLILLGLFDPLQRMMSFPIVNIGETSISLWVVIKAVLILVVFIFVSRMLRAYLDYKVYPSVGVETGLAYVLNTFLNYFVLIAGFLISMRIVGLDFRVFMVFAGAIGIGLGFGMKDMAANMISGLMLVFGRKLHKGDWIEVDERVGMVKEISLRATKVQTRDNIEYIMPNDQFVSSTVINYTLASPLIRLHIPVGVSYDADPEAVKNILLEAARQNGDVIVSERSEVFFTEFGDNSLNFSLLIWFNISKIGKRRVRSRLYFSIFKELKKAGIEIPFPQRDLHLRSMPGPVQAS